LSLARILIVDDHESICNSLRRLLSTGSGLQVCGEAHDGIDAIEKAKELKPDLVLMDVNMPRMNGLEATRLIRKEMPGTEVLIISQNEPAMLRGQANEVGARGYISKSDVGRELLNAVHEIVGAKAP
jgi:two-component system, NarL family, invasion response regulator UvrY